MSRRPNVSTVWATTRSHCGGSVRLAWSATARRPIALMSATSASASAFERAYVRATSAPRFASSRATSAPIRFAPVMSATLLVRSIKEKAGRLTLPPFRLSRPSSQLLAEGAEECRTLVRIAPLGAERGAREGVLIGLSHVRVIRVREGREPLLRAAGRIVVDFLRHVERDVRRRHVNR